MARRRSAERESSTAEGLVPAELLDIESKVWASVGGNE